ncbi:MAG: hypothetical protein K2P81_07280 [Bacteriovoracaceae bacterium]|nr:hypothetical protein [Bacteriovoracaceae bacterium]
MRASIPWSFFCIVPPGLSDLAFDEFMQKRQFIGASDAIPQKSPQGLEVTLPWEVGTRMLQMLKIPTRIIVRLEKFQARDFPKIYQKCAQFPWQKWLSHPEPAWKISANQCRLMHTGRLEETFREALKEAHRQRPFPERYKKENIQPETLYVRGENDEWTISLDISGEPLYKRGSSIIKGEAPIRENLAAACLAFMFEELPTQPINLWDPMCGSGTLLFEALDYFNPTKREFAFEKSALHLGVPKWNLKNQMDPWPILKTHGSDIDQNLISKLNKEYVNFFVHDFIEENLNHKVASPLWIISNPPYGERIEIKPGRRDFAKKLCHSIEQNTPDKCLLIVPQDWPAMQINGSKPQKTLEFFNGGLAVEARLWILNG